MNWNKYKMLLVILTNLFILPVTVAIGVCAGNANQTIQELSEMAKATNNSKQKSEIAYKISQMTPVNITEIETLLDLINEKKDENIKGAAVSALNKVKDPAFGNIFYKRIKTGDYVTRGISIVKVGELKYKEAVPDLIQIVREHHRYSKKLDPEGYQLQIAAAFALADIGDERAIPVLLSKLGKMNDMEPQIIAKFGRKALPNLEQVMNRSKDEDERKAAYNAIALMKDKELIPEMWRKVTADPVNNGAYISALFNMVDKATSPNRKELEDFIVKAAAKNSQLKGRAIVIAKSRSDINYLTNIVKDKNVDQPQRESAIIYLGDLKAQSAVPVLLEALKDNSRDIRFLAAQSLDKITGKKYEWRKQ